GPTMSASHRSEFPNTITVPVHHGRCTRRRSRRTSASERSPLRILVVDGSCQRRREDASAGRSKTASGWDAKGLHQRAFAGDKQDEKRIASRRMLPRHRALPHRPCSRCLTDLLAEPQLPFSNPIQNASLMFGPVELWATRWRHPSAAANPQGFCWPATPPVTHVVARVMLIRLIDCPSMKIGREQSSLGLVVAQLSCLW